MGARNNARAMTVDCSDHLGDSIFTGATTKILTTGKVGMEVCSTLVPMPTLSFTAHCCGYGTNIVMATSRGPTGCGKCGTCKPSKYRVASSTTTVMCRRVRGASMLANTGCVSFTRKIRRNLVHFMKSSYGSTLCRTVRSHRIHPNLYGDTKLGLMCDPLGKSKLMPMAHMLGSVKVASMAVMPRRRCPGKCFAAYDCPGPRVFTTLRLKLGLTGRANTSLVLTASPSTSHMKVTVGYPSKSCRLISKGRMKILLLSCVTTKHVRGNAVPRGPMTIGSLMSAPLTSTITRRCKMRLHGMLAKFG